MSYRQNLKEKKIFILDRCRPPENNLLYNKSKPLSTPDMSYIKNHKKTDKNKINKNK